MVILLLFGAEINNHPKQFLHAAFRAFDFSSSTVLDFSDVGSALRDCTAGREGKDCADKG
jgi:hypothetical protein